MNPRHRVPRQEVTGLDPGILEDLERGAVPAGWESAGKAKGPRRFYGFNATNQCCRRWMLLGWPDVDGRPKLLEENGGRLRVACPKCGADLWFDLANPDLVELREGKVQPPCIVGGIIHRSPG